MWLLPVLLLGVIAVAVSKSPRASRPAPRQLLPAPEVPALRALSRQALPGAEVPCQPLQAMPPLPGPIAVLGEILRVGQYPAPTVVLCAIAEAEAIGRRDLVADIVSAFVAPVVYQHWALHGHSPAAHERGSCAAAQPRSTDHERGSCSSQYERGSCASRTPATVESSPPEPPRQATQDEILSMLHSDPGVFIAMMEGHRPPAAVVVTPIVPEVPDQGHAAAQPCEVSEQVREASPGSPLGGVADEDWRQFVTRLERESPTFSSTRHVGQYRQRRERLADLGIDPGSLQGSSAAQRTALDADLSDAYNHAFEGGLTECLGRPILVPGQETPQAITLSGLLGVIQCAGLDGAVGWLESFNDRKRYPHTTQVFCHTNGVF